GNSMDQNHNGTAGEPVTGSIGDTYAAPAPVNGALAPPFDRTTRPLIIPGPHIANTQFSQQFTATGNQVNLPVPAVGTGGAGDQTKDVTLSTITINQPGVTIGDLNLNLNLLHA